MLVIAKELCVVALPVFDSQASGYVARDEFVESVVGTVD
jgi:hypothetical protein